MPELIRASDAQIERVLEESYPIWNEGLTKVAYTRWNTLQRRTSWGSGHLRRMALVEGEEVLASAKWYDLDATLDGSPIRVLGIGAVFTPESRRGEGHAPALVRAMMDDAAREGYGAALLFSEIGAAYYERLGFSIIARDTVTLRVKHKPGTPAILLRVGEDADLVHFAEFHQPSGRGLFATRSIDLMKFAIAKRRMRTALAPIGSRVLEFFVTEEGCRAAAYVLISRGPSGNLGDGPEVMWLEACGDRDPTGARVGAMLLALYARTPAETPPPLYAWLPDGWLPPQLEIAERAPAEDVMMIAPLGATKLPALDGKNSFWWHADYF